jgi:hypothetical protein
MYLNNRRCVNLPSGNNRERDSSTRNLVSLPGGALGRVERASWALTAIAGNFTLTQYWST